MGSNVEPEKNLCSAVARLSEMGRPVKVSRVYQSAAVAAESQDDFLNAAALVSTELSPIEVVRQLREIEASMGRERASDAGVAIDLDLCFYGTEILSTPEITIPRPEILEHAFIAVPLAELMPEFVHPVSGETLSTIAEKLRRSCRLTVRPDVVTDFR